MNSMPSLQIRELPEDVYAALAYRAKQAGGSLAQQVLDEIARRPKPDTTGWPSPEELIRRDRER